MDALKAKLRALLFLIAIGLLLVGLIRVYGKVSSWDMTFLVGGGLSLGLALRMGGGAKRPLPPTKPTPKSGA
ncbi:MAG: hypothetical protein EXS13_09190 [Planctomycetes bacterium]|nr:hypothetical protein [Planctomycetota bacterium]